MGQSEQHVIYRLMAGGWEGGGWGGGGEETDGERLLAPVLTYVSAAQKNPLTETVLLSTHNICFG